MILPQVVKDGKAQRIVPNTMTDLLSLDCEWVEATPSPPVRGVKSRTLFPFPEDIAVSEALGFYKAEKGWGMMARENGIFVTTTDIEFLYLDGQKTADFKAIIQAKVRGRTHGGGFVNGEAYYVLTVPLLGKVGEFDFAKADFKTVSRKSLDKTLKLLTEQNAEAYHTTPPPPKD